MAKTRIIGRILRFCLGLFFVFEVWPVYQSVNNEGVIIRLTWALGLLIFYIAIHLLIVKYISNLNRMIGAILAFGPLLAVFFFIGYGGPAATGALTFFGCIANCRFTSSRSRM